MQHVIYLIAIASLLNAGCNSKKGKSDGSEDQAQAGTSSTASEVGQVLSSVGGVNGKNSLVNLTSEPSSANCVSGGSKIQSGLDGNSNNTLDPSEVTATSYACNGSQGSPGVAINSLVKSTAVSPGANCSNGGSKIESGLDDNGDDTLQAGEVDITSYACNGAAGVAGSAGAPGFNSLVTVASESPSGNCTFGGSRILTGLDNGDGGSIPRDGILSPGEVDSTSYVCQGLPERRNLRFTDSLLSSAATDSEKDTQCTSEFGANFMTATYLDAAHNLPAVVLPWSVYGFAVAGQTYSFRPQEDSFNETVSLRIDTTGSARIACIYKFTTLRFTRSQLSSSENDQVKNASCQSEFGSRYIAATVQDVSAGFTNIGAIDSNAFAPWTAKGSTFGYRIISEAKSHFTLARVASGVTSVVACQLQ